MKKFLESCYRKKKASYINTLIAKMIIFLSVKWNTFLQIIDVYTQEYFSILLDNMNQTVKKIGDYQGRFMYKDNILSITFTNKYKIKIFYTNITNQNMPQLKQIADNPQELFQIICDLANDKILINDTEQLVLYIGIGKKVKQFVINLQKVHISKEETFNKRIQQFQTKMEQKQLELKFYKQQYLLLLNNLQLKPKIQEISKFYRINAQNIFINGQQVQPKSFSSAISQKTPIAQQKAQQPDFKNKKNTIDKVDYLCPKMHHLYMYNSKNYNNRHLCNICRAKIQNDSIQYRCLQCDFDVCHKCIIKPPQHRKYCPKMHRLRFGVAKNLRICDQCQNKFSFDGAYSCLECDYDLCINCYKQVEQWK